MKHAAGIFNSFLSALRLVSWGRKEEKEEKEKKEKNSFGMNLMHYGVS